MTILEKQLSVGVFETTLLLNKEVEFETLEGEILNVSIYQDFSHQLCHLVADQMYTLRIRLDLEMVQGRCSSIEDSQYPDILI